MTDESEHYEKRDEDPGHLEARIQKRAYEMWESEGCPDGKADMYWHRAKELIEDENQSAYPPAQSRGSRN
jgi:hypothetical protein